jgi:hypothetical protein
MPSLKSAKRSIARARRSAKSRSAAPCPFLLLRSHRNAIDEQMIMLLLQDSNTDGFASSL